MTDKPLTIGPPILLVHGDDLETPIESLRLNVYVKPPGYLKDAVQAAKRYASIYVAKGDAYLVPGGLTP